MIYYVECGISGVKIGEYDSSKFTFQEVVSIARREIRFPEPFGYCIIWVGNKRIAKVEHNWQWITEHYR